MYERQQYILQSAYYIYYKYDVYILAILSYQDYHAKCSVSVGCADCRIPCKFSFPHIQLSVRELMVMGWWIKLQRRVKDDDEHRQVEVSVVM